MDRYVTRLYYHKRIVLEKHPHIKNVTINRITYTENFKQLIIRDLNRGLSANQAFAKHGLPVELIGENRVRTAANRWRKKYQQFREVGLIDMREFNHNPYKRNLVAEYREKYQFLKMNFEQITQENLTMQTIIKQQVSDLSKK